MSRPNDGRLIQPRVPGLRREFKVQGLVPDVQAQVARDAARFGVSESFVKAEIITDHYERILGRKFDQFVRISEAADRPVNLNKRRRRRS